MISPSGSPQKGSTSLKMQLSEALTEKAELEVRIGLFTRTSKAARRRKICNIQSHASAKNFLLMSSFARSNIYCRFHTCNRLRFWSREK